MPMVHFPPRHEYRKPVVASADGLVAAQSMDAAHIGASILAKGGNAADACVGVSLALGVVEPWMSGLGGGGYAMFRDGQSGAALCLDFGMISPRRLNPDDYPLVAGVTSNALFGWPSVLEDRNVKGPYSIAAPGLVAGLALAHRTYGSLPWKSVVAPVIELAEAGLPIDWYSSLAILVEARDLAQEPVARAHYLKDGLPPLPALDGSVGRLKSPELAASLKALAGVDGPASFYHGAIAHKLIQDMAGAGSKLDKQDLESYRAQFVRPLEIGYRDASIYAPSGLTAGPALARVLSLWKDAFASPFGQEPSWGRIFRALNQGLETAYRERLSDQGAIESGLELSVARVDPPSPASFAEAKAKAAAKKAARKKKESETPPSECTSHFCIVDKRGNMVAWTQTLLSRFGSKVMSPQTGVLMNNGIMWFDPTPNRQNSIAPGRRPLSNMCPAIALSPRFGALAIGASGGRKIMPAVAQILSFLIDFEMSLEGAFHQPRIDNSGAGITLMDRRLPEGVRAVTTAGPSASVDLLAYPAHFANPSAVQIDLEGKRLGATDIASPWSGAIGTETIQEKGKA
jgi:gamma-glutamyltranspeptidase/glutathione hydrolase